MLQFIEDNSSSLAQKDYDQAYKVWSGFDIVVRLKSIDLGPENFASYKVKSEDQYNTIFYPNYSDTIILYHTCAKIKTNLLMRLKNCGTVAKKVDFDMMPHSASFDFGLPCLVRPVCPNTKSN